MNKRWIKHLNIIRIEHPELTYNQIQKLASQTYKRKQKKRRKKITLQSNTKLLVVSAPPLVFNEI